jgi:nitrogen regulatory protein PII-like uncharacterized protein
MKDNKVRKSNHTENSVGIYSSAVNQAKINGINGVPQIEFDKLSEDEKNQWKALAAKNKEDIEAFYRNNANQIKFTLLHKIVILVLEEIFNEQPENNPYYWLRNKPADLSDFGVVYTNYNILSNYIWGDNNGKKADKIKKVIQDLYNADVYISYVVEKEITKNGKKSIESEWRAERLHLITTIGDKCDLAGRNRCSYVQLHQIFVRRLSKRYIQRKNCLYQKLRDYYQEISKNTNKKNFNVLPSEEVIDMASYFMGKARSQKYEWTFNEETLAHDLNIKDYFRGQVKRGCKKMCEALNALHFAGMIKNWEVLKGVQNQRKYRVVLNSDFFGIKEEDANKLEKSVS